MSNTWSRRGLKRYADQEPEEVFEEVPVEPEPAPAPQVGLTPTPPSYPPPRHLYEEKAKPYSLRQHILDVAAKGGFWMPMRFEKPLVPGPVNLADPKFLEEPHVPQVVSARYDVNVSNKSSENSETHAHQPAMDGTTHEPTAREDKSMVDGTTHEPTVEDKSMVDGTPHESTMEETPVVDGTVPESAMEPAAGPSVNECGTDRCETKDSEPVENETTTKWYQTTEDDEEWKTDLDKMLEGFENAKI